jgi:hypothetical protein
MITAQPQSAGVAPTRECGLVGKIFWKTATRKTKKEMGGLSDDVLEKSDAWKNWVGFFSVSGKVTGFGIVLSGITTGALSLTQLLVFCGRRATN